MPKYDDSTEPQLFAMLKAGVHESRTDTFTLMLLCDSHRSEPQDLEVGGARK